MSTVVCLRIESWQDKFVVVGEFYRHSEIPRRVFGTYQEALTELSKTVQREELRYASGYCRNTDRKLDSY